MGILDLGKALGERTPLGVNPTSTTDEENKLSCMAAENLQRVTLTMPLNSTWNECVSIDEDK
jgi:hypothetical protein